MGTSGQDESIGRYTLPPCTTKRRTTTHLKTKNNQNGQKIKLYGSPTTKELKKKHLSRPVGGVEKGCWGRQDSWQGSSWKTRVGEMAAGGAGGPTPSLLCADKPGGTTGKQDRLCNPAFQRGEIKP